MFQFFDWLVGLVGTVIEFVVGFFNMLSGLLSFIYTAFSFLFTVLSFLPDFALYPIIAVVGFVVVVQLLNKGA